MNARKEVLSYLNKRYVHLVQEEELDLTGAYNQLVSECSGRLTSTYNYFTNEPIRSARCVKEPNETDASSISNSKPDGKKKALEDGVIPNKKDKDSGQPNLPPESKNRPDPQEIEASLKKTKAKLLKANEAIQQMSEEIKELQNEVIVNYKLYGRFPDKYLHKKIVDPNSSL